MADFGADVIHVARFYGHLRAVLLFDHEGAFKTINQLMPTGMHVPWQVLTGRKFNKEHQRLLARHALQIGLKKLLGGGCILRGCLRPGSGTDHGPICQKAADNHKDSDTLLHLHSPLWPLTFSPRPTVFVPTFATSVCPRAADVALSRLS